MELTTDELVNMAPADAKKVFTAAEVAALYRFRQIHGSSASKLQRTVSKTTFSDSLQSSRINEFLTEYHHQGIDMRLFDELSSHSFNNGHDLSTPQFSEHAANFPSHHHFQSFTG